MTKIMLLYVFIGGGTGSVLRYLIGRLMHSLGLMMISGTLIVNIAGSLLIGGIIHYTMRVPPSLSNTNLSLLLATGFCGGFTTFSAFSFENFTLLREGQIAYFFLYSLSSLILGLLSVWAGMGLSKLFGV